MQVYNLPSHRDVERLTPSFLHNRSPHGLPPPPRPPAQYQDAPLHLAALKGHEAACRVLIEAEAKVDAANKVS